MGGHMRRSLVACVVASLSVLPVVAVVAPAVGADLPVYSHRAVLMTTGVKASVPGRPGMFHAVRVEAGLVDDYVASPEEPHLIHAEVVDYSCPTGFSLDDFLLSTARCTQRGATYADGTGVPFVDDVLGQSLGVRADLEATDGTAWPVDLRFEVTSPGRAESLVAADSFFTWKVEDGFGGASRVTGTVGPVSLSRAGWSRYSYGWARWQRYTASPWRSDRGAPQELGWSLNARLITHVNLTVSKLGWLSGRRGNFHVGSWHVDGDDYESILEPLSDFRCPDPAAASAADPEGSGCVKLGEGAGDDFSMVFDATWGHKLVLRQQNGDVVRFRPAGTPTVTLNTGYPTATFRSGCSVSGDHTWAPLGHVHFGSAWRVEACDFRQDAYYRAG